MRCPHRRGPAGLIAVVLSVWLSLSACTGGTAAAPTSQTPLTPAGSLVEERTPPASPDASTSPEPSSTPGSSTTTLSSKFSSVQSTTTASSSSATPSPTASPSANPTLSKSSISAPSTTRPATSRSSTTAAPPTTSSTPSTAPGPTTKAPPAASTTRPSRSTGVETVIMNAEEINTRKEIEKAWLDYWTIFVVLNKIPKGDRLEAFGNVAIEPELSSLIDAAERADQKELVNFGEVVHHVYWGPPVSGKSSAVIGDCTDQTHFGAKNRKTGDIEVIGGKEGNYNGTLQKVGKVWKVSYLDFRGEAC